MRRAAKPFSRSRARAPPAERAAPPSFPISRPAPNASRELFDPRDRRYRYPFTNCTPLRPALLASSRTCPTTAPARRCAASRCARPAAPNTRIRPTAASTPSRTPARTAGRSLRCGMRRRRGPSPMRDAALLAAAAAIRDGADRRGEGPRRLPSHGRRARTRPPSRGCAPRKRREEKPFAVMFPSLAAVEAGVPTSAPAEAALLDGAAAADRARQADAAAASPRARSRPATRLARRDAALHAAPPSPAGGARLPGRRDQRQPLRRADRHRRARRRSRRLAGIADLFLVHDRPIVRPVDDSVVAHRRRSAAAPPPRPRLRARRRSPRDDLPPGILALGGHLKATVALDARQRASSLSQHLGDLETAEARDAYDRARADIAAPARHRARASSSATSIPTTTRATLAEASGLPVVARPAPSRPRRRLHGRATASQPPVLGVAWDGTGYGPDGTVWGGEFLLVTDDRLAARRPPSAVPPARRRSRGPRAAPRRRSACCSPPSGRPLAP